MPTDDGVTLAGWWVRGENGAAVVLLHGAGSTRTAVLDHADVLTRHGYGVLLLDARGHGESGGRGMDFGWYGERDAAAAVDFLGHQPAVNPQRIGLVGLSMGGEEALGAAGVDARVRAVVAEGATNRVAADKGYLTHYGVRGHVQRAIDPVTYAVARLLSGVPEPQPLRESVTAAQVDGTPTPMLLVPAGQVETEELAAEYLQQAASDAVDVWTVPNASHIHGCTRRQMSGSDVWCSSSTARCQVSITWHVMSVVIPAHGGRTGRSPARPRPAGWWSLRVDPRCLLAAFNRDKTKPLSRSG